MNYPNRPTGLHQKTWNRFNRAILCTGFPPPPIVETVSYRFRNDSSPPSDGNFQNEQGDSEAYSSTFVCAIEIGSPWNGDNLATLGICLIHQGLVLFAPIVADDKPYSYMVIFDTNLPLHFNAARAVMTFIECESSEGCQPYSRAWARRIQRVAWPPVFSKIRKNLCENSDISFE